MATPVEPRSILSEPQVIIPKTERLTIVSPLGWASIFAGAVMALGVWLVLHLLGIGIGLTAIDANDPGSLRSAGIGAGIWSLLVPLIALFVGGLVVGRVAPTINTLNAALHGAVVWALATTLALVTLSMIVTSMVRGAVSTATSVAGSATEAVGRAASAADDLSLETLGLSDEDLVAPINRRLQAEGMPPVRTEELSAAMKEALRTRVRGGDIDRATLVDIAAKHTKLSRQEAERVAAAMQQEIDQLRQRGADIMSKAGRVALDAAETTGKIILGLSVIMLLGLGAAVGGAVLSVRHERKVHVVMPPRPVRTPAV